MCYSLGTYMLDNFKAIPYFHFNNNKLIDASKGLRVAVYTNLGSKGFVVRLLTHVLFKVMLYFYML